MNMTVNVDQQLVLVIGAVWLILTVVGDWLLFRKAGRLGILSLIPGVNLIVEYSICWSGLVGLIFFLLMGGANYLAGQEMTQPAGLAGLVAVVLNWVESMKLSRSFGKGFGYGLFLFFFGRFARVILGLSSARYVGKR